MVIDMRKVLDSVVDYRRFFFKILSSVFFELAPFNQKKLVVRLYRNSK